MSKGSSLAKNTLILGFGKISTQIVNFLLLPLYTYALSPSEYGFIDLVIIYITLLIPALTLQLEMASFRFLVDARSSHSDKVRIISNILYMITALILPWALLLCLLGLLVGFPYTFSVLGAGLSMLCANSVLQITRGIGDNKQYALASIFTASLTALGAALFVYFIPMGVNGVLLSLTLANLASALYVIFKLRLYKYVKYSALDKALQRTMLGYSVPLVPNGISWWVISAADRTVITIMISAAANGVYAVASRYGSILNSLFSIFNMSWTESASLHIDAKDNAQFFSKVSNSAVRLFGSLGLGLIAIIPFIFHLLVDESFGDAYLYIPILVIGAFLNAIVGLYSAIYIAKRLTRQVMNTSLVAAVVSVILTVGLIPFFGLYAAAIATSLAFLVMAIFRHYDVKKYVLITYEKYIFFVLAVLYAVIITLYYVSELWATTIGLSIAIISAYVLNRHEFSSIKSIIVGKIRK